MYKFFTGLLIALTAMAGIYAVAATIATNLTPSFATAETTRYTRIVEFATAMKRAAAEHRTARAKCELLSGAEKSLCDADATAEQRRARIEARFAYKGGAKAPADTSVEVRKTARAIDVALYRAHRQLPN